MESHRASDPQRSADGSLLRPDLEPTIRALPREPGVYLFRDGNGRVLYVGKAKSLRNRVRTYFRETGDGRYSVPFIRRRTAMIESIVTASEKEALILEDTLIKEHRPRYNVRLRDDKSFYFLRLRLDHPAPYVELVRRPRDDGNPTYGPFPSALAARKTRDLLHKLFPLRRCSNNKYSNRSRACLDHQIGKCPAPCVGAVSQEAYGALVEGAKRFLDGERREVKQMLSARMQAASEALRFEDAAMLRDQLSALEHTAEEQLIVRFGKGSADYWGIAADDTQVSIIVIRVVEGTVVHTDTFPGLKSMAQEDALEQAMLQYYGADRQLPERIYTSVLPPSPEVLQQVLEERRGKRVHLRKPRRGEPRRLQELAQRNAESTLGRNEAQPYEHQAQRLAKLLQLPHPPQLIECYDVSVHQGQHPVGVGVAFEGGVEDTQRRRRYRLTPGEGRGDVQWLQEMLRRRLERGIRESDLPDLIVLDGGKAQLSAITRLYRELEVEWSRVPLVALAKARTNYDREDAATGPSERIYLPGRKNPVILKPGAAEFRLLVGLRDATHHAAVGYHRRRGRSTLIAGLEQIAGMGPARRNRLQEAYPDLRGVLNDNVDEISRAAGIPIAVAKRVRSAIEKLHVDTGLDTLNAD